MKIMAAVFPAVSSHQHVDDLQHGASVGQPALRRRRRLPQQGRRRRGEGVVELGCRGGRRRGGRGAGGLGVPAVVAVAAVAAVAVAGSRSRLGRIFGPHLCFKVLYEMSSYTCSLLSLPRKQGKDFQGTGILPELCSCYSGKASLLPPRRPLDVFCLLQTLSSTDCWAKMASDSQRSGAPRFVSLCGVEVFLPPSPLRFQLGEEGGGDGRWEEGGFVPVVSLYYTTLAELGLSGVGLPPSSDELFGALCLERVKRAGGECFCYASSLFIPCMGPSPHYSAHFCASAVCGRSLRCCSRIERTPSHT